MNKRYNDRDDDDSFHHKTPKRFEKDVFSKHKKAVYDLIDNEDDEEDYFTENYSSDEDEEEQHHGRTP